MLTGTVYRNKEEENFRLLHVGKENSYIIKLGNTGGNLPKKIKTDTLYKMIESGELKEEQPDQEVILDEELTEKQVQKRDRYFKVINSYWSEPNSRRKLLDKSSRRKVIKAMSRELGVSESQATRLLSKFLKGGMTRNSLVPAYRKRSGKQNNGSKKGVGGLGLPMDSVMRDNFERGYKRFFLKEGRTLKRTHEMICSHYYKESYEKNDLSLQPTYKQFYNWVSANKSRYERDVSRMDSKKFKNDKQVLGAYSSSESCGIGDIFEADATHLDIYLVSEADKKTIIGKPLLTSVVDVYSSMIVGINLSLHNESWETYASAFYNTVENKVDFAKEFGVEINEQDWPCHYLPTSFLLDNGAGKSVNMDPICHNYGVENLHTETYRGSAKGKVERSHQKFEDYIKENLPGSLQDDHGQRGAPDYSKDACLTLSELTGIIIRLVVLFNSKPIDKHPLDPELALKGKSASPREIWEESFSFNNNLRGAGNLEDFRIITMPHELRKPQRDGIHLNSLVYTIDGKENTKVYYDAVAKGKAVEVHYDIVDIRYAFVKLGAKHYRFHAKDSRYANLRLSLEELKQIAKINNENRKRAEFNNRKLGAATDKEIKEIYEKAQQRVNKAEPFSREERQAEIRREKLSRITSQSAVQEEVAEASDRYDEVRKAAIRRIEERTRKTK